jgi:hypothetical protein
LSSLDSYASGISALQNIQGPRGPRYCRGRSRLYFAAPKDLYSTQQYHAALAIARMQFRGARFVLPALRHWTNEQWRAKWSKILPRIDLITVTPREEDFSIGAGCYRELTDARARGIPVSVFDPGRKAFLPIRLLRMVPLANRTLVRYAFAYPGRRP